MNRIEQLDKQYPGITQQVGTWFDQGLSAQAVSDRLQEMYGVTVAETTVGNHRRHRWARARRQEEERLAETKAEKEFRGLLEMKARGFADVCEVGK